MIFSNNNNNETVVSLIANAIRRDISFGELAPDSRLKIEVLRTRYGGSTHSLREALTLLSTQGLVEANAQRGFRVSSATINDLQDIIRLRCEIEKLALTWSLQNSDVKWEGQLIAAHHTLLHVQEGVINSPIDTALAWDDANRQFHISLAAACGSPRLIIAQQQLFDQSRRFSLTALREGHLNFTLIADNNNRLVQAVLARDTDTAIKLLQQNITANCTPSYFS